MRVQNHAGQCDIVAIANQTRASGTAPDRITATQKIVSAWPDGNEFVIASRSRAAANHRGRVRVRRAGAAAQHDLVVCRMTLPTASLSRNASAVALDQRRRRLGPKPHECPGAGNISHGACREPVRALGPIRGAMDDDRPILVDLVDAKKCAARRSMAKQRALRPARTDRTTAAWRSMPRGRRAVKWSRGPVGRDAEQG